MKTSRQKSSKREDLEERGSDQCPLVVDLDGSLLMTDLLWEAIIQLVITRPLTVISFPFWLLRGIAFFKNRISEYAQINADSLPYQPDVLAYLEGEFLRRRRLILATASHRKWAELIATHLGLFTDVLASDQNVNLKGKTKLLEIRRLLGENTEFDYLGDGHVDIPIWKESRSSLMVHPSFLLRRRVQRSDQTSISFRRGSTRGAEIFRALRPHQWVKNILLFVPLVLAHESSNLSLLFEGFIAFSAFSLSASGVYLLNDLSDLSADRIHPTKRFRPFASGSVPPQLGIFLAPVLFIVGFSLSATWLPSNFSLILLGYIGLTSTYSLFLKRVVLLDVLVLAALYTLRLVAGGLAVGVMISHWLFAFSIFFFLSLAFVKRYAELEQAQLDSGEKLARRGYRAVDIELLRTMGISSGFISVLVFALYISTGEVSVLYSTPELLWIIGPLMLYWLSRIWLIANRGEMHDDPVVFTAKDRVSYLVGFFILMLILLAV